MAPAGRRTRGSDQAQAPPQLARQDVGGKVSP
jgi:hypothetical protein